MFKITYTDKTNMEKKELDRRFTNKAEAEVMAYNLNNMRMYKKYYKNAKVEAC